MTKVHVIGRKRDLEAVLEHLYRLRVVQLLDVREEPELELGPPPGEHALLSRRDELRLLLARLDGLLDLLGAQSDPTPAALLEAAPAHVDPVALRAELDALAPEVEALTECLESLRSDEIVLRRYVGLLEHLLALVPELRALDERDLSALRLATIALVLNTADAGVVDLLREELSAKLGARFYLVSAPVDPEAIGCVLLFPEPATEEVHALLGQERVRHVPLPEAYEALSLHASVEAMQRRLEEIPGDLAAARQALDALLEPRAANWRIAHEDLLARLERLDAVSCAGSTRRTFAVVGWVPRPELPGLRAELAREHGGTILLEEQPLEARDTSAPVLMRNPAPVRPFECLVRVLDLPRARSLDPTGLMALFLPLMFGLMVGDVVYGAVLLGIALLVRRRLGPGYPAVRDLSRVLAMGSVWAIVFGFLFGEALGDLGEKWVGMPAIWLRRGGPDALEPLLLFAVAAGAAHVVLGVLLGLWQSWRDRASRAALDRVGTLLVLGGIFALAAVAADRLPEQSLTPAVAAAVVGLVLVTSLHGALGLMLGPLELIGILGNILSYLRLAAVGLASVYLAIIANELALVGPLWLGVIVAMFLHALNLVLAAFTPAIQALRLHYVEFFGKFYVGGGQAFRPFGERARRETLAGRGRMAAHGTLPEPAS